MKRSIIQLVGGVVILYSLMVAASTIPDLHSIPNTVNMVYYLFVPGLALTLLIRSSKTILDLLFYSIVWSFGILAFVYALESISLDPRTLPISLVVPVLTLAFVGLENIRGRTDLR